MEGHTGQWDGWHFFDNQHVNDMDIIVVLRSSARYLCGPRWQHLTLISCMRIFSPQLMTSLPPTSSSLSTSLSVTWAVQVGKATTRVCVMLHRMLYTSMLCRCSCWLWHSHLLVAQFCKSANYGTLGMIIRKRSLWISHGRDPGSEAYRVPICQQHRSIGAPSMSKQPVGQTWGMLWGTWLYGN